MLGVTLRVYWIVSEWEVILNIVMVRLTSAELFFHWTCAGWILQHQRAGNSSQRDAWAGRQLRVAAVWLLPDGQHWSLWGMGCHSSWHLDHFFNPGPGLSRVEWGNVKSSRYPGLSKVEWNKEKPLQYLTLSKMEWGKSETLLVYQIVQSWMR